MNKKSIEEEDVYMLGGLGGDKVKNLVDRGRNTGEGGLVLARIGKGVAGQGVGLQISIRICLGLDAHIHNLDVGAQTVGVEELLVDGAVVARVRDIHGELEILDALGELGGELCAGRKSGTMTGDHMGCGMDGLVVLERLDKSRYVGGKTCDGGSERVGTDKRDSVASKSNELLSDRGIVDVVNTYKGVNAVILKKFQHGLAVGATGGIKINIKVHVLDGLLGMCGRSSCDMVIMIGMAGMSGIIFTGSRHASRWMSGRGHARRWRRRSTHHGRLDHTVSWASCSIKGRALVAISGLYIVITNAIEIMGEGIITIILMFPGKMDVLHGRNIGIQRRTNQIIRIILVKFRINIVGPRDHEPELCIQIGHCFSFIKKNFFFLCKIEIYFKKYT